EKDGPHSSITRLALAGYPPLEQASHLHCYSHSAGRVPYRAQTFLVGRNPQSADEKFDFEFLAELLTNSDKLPMPPPIHLFGVADLRRSPGLSLNSAATPTLPY